MLIFSSYDEKRPPLPLNSYGYIPFAGHDFRDDNSLGISFFLFLVICGPVQSFFNLNISTHTRVVHSESCGSEPWKDEMAAHALATTQKLAQGSQSNSLGIKQSNSITSVDSGYSDGPALPGRAQSPHPIRFGILSTTAPNSSETNPQGLTSEYNRRETEEAGVDLCRKRGKPHTDLALEIGKKDQLPLWPEHEENLPWTHTAAGCQSNPRESHQSMAVHMFTEPLRERIRPWTDFDTNILHKAYDYTEKSTFATRKPDARRESNDARGLFNKSSTNSETTPGNYHIGDREPASDDSGDSGSDFSLWTDLTTSETNRAGKRVSSPRSG